ncbi:P-loop containing nucleoside triphosphate hydrolase protein [Lyophyllum atratum]|nr:P-loop containing nucleoside triphosphate hydrolase protein [Lyophyllum atratum]
MSANDQRSARLNRLLDTILKGKINLETENQCKQFIEAICIQPDPPQCIERVTLSPHGLPSIQAAIYTDISADAPSELGLSLLTYIQAPAIKTLNNGQLLNQVLRAIVESSSFWTSFITAFKERKLDVAGQISFAWTLFHLIHQIPAAETTSPHFALAKELEYLLLTSPHIDVRNLGQKIKLVTSTPLSSPSAALAQDDIAPGGRHDNDFVDFRDIAILPTADELASTEEPFLLQSAAYDDPSTEANRQALYLDNQFRLLREDMIYEMREEMQIVQGKQQGKKSRGFVIQGFGILRCDVGDGQRRTKWSLVMECHDDFPQFYKLSPAKRKQYLKDNYRFLKHQSLMCLVVDGEVLAFPSIRRDEELLVKDPPQIVLELDGKAAIEKLLLRMKSAKQVKLVPVDVAVFAYEPVLSALKKIRLIPLSDDLLFWKKGSVPSRLTLPSRLHSVVNFIKSAPGADIGSLLRLNKKINLDLAQQKSLLAGLTQSVSIIQGPPGTGKSFIGALLAKLIYDFSDLKILVVCYTNHALDQFLEDLLDIGIDSDSMVRLGGQSKATIRTKPMLLQNLKQQTNFPLSRDEKFIIGSMKGDIEERAQDLHSSFQRYLQSSTGNAELMDYLANHEEGFGAAFRVPEADDGMIMVGGGGRVADEFYLLDRWRSGGHAGIYSHAPNVRGAREIWSLPKAAREAFIAHWVEHIRKEEVEGLSAMVSQYNTAIEELLDTFKEKDAFVLRSKRIIGCTTTAAAMYTGSIRKAAPDVVLVEEAGEILESHVITALGRAAKQLILIGDHKQLRPKVNNYKLTVEKGEGYNLNMSLFERLVLKGYPHGTLVAQHRMRPEISSLIRHLTYPDLLDAPKTQGRPDIRGVQDNVIFINHDQPEGELRNVADTRDVESKSSKENMYEARMVLKIVKYLAQQGYGTDKMVVLTPYLGQLSLLRKQLNEENDPVLNDLDSWDLIQAGLLPPGGPKTSKPKLRLATIDNYQGEESDIVIASLTRSNPNHDIGFMFSPERLNVLLSRARNGLILIGDSNTFTKSKKGGPLWQKFFAHIKSHIYDGFPVKCEQHPRKKALLVSEVQFEQHCPEGGCNELCGAFLSCGIHQCSSKCHQLYDHSKIRCEGIVRAQCHKGHNRSRWCYQPFPLCKKCIEEAKNVEAKRQEELARQRIRDEAKAVHLRRQQEIERQIAEEKAKLLRKQQEIERQLAEEKAEQLRRKREIERKIAEEKRLLLEAQLRREWEAKSITDKAGTIIKGWTNWLGGKTSS